MQKMIYGLLVALVLLICTGCGEHIIINGVSYRVLSKEEEKEMVQFARMTLIKGEKLTLAQQNYIRSNEPEVRISYTGSKIGRASYQWICDDAVMVRLNCEGEFLSENMKVNTRKTKLQEKVKKGEKAVLEKLTFKEIQY